LLLNQPAYASINQSISASIPFNRSKTVITERADCFQAARQATTSRFTLSVLRTIGIFRSANTCSVIARVGLPRSGTTLVHRMLSMHSQVDGIIEPYQQGRILLAKRCLKKLEQRVSASLTAVMKQRAHSQSAATSADN